jgi:MFS family permease
VSRVERLLALAVTSFRPHFAVFLAAALGLLVLAVTTGWRWTYWTAMVWGILLLVHYLIYKTRTVDERWVAERTEELHLKSYDRDHIQNIRVAHGRDDTPGADTPGSDPARR